MTTLVDKMRKRATVDKTNAAVLLSHAAAMEATVSRYTKEGGQANMKSFIGAWARARMFWCDLTGEPLV